MHHSRRDYQDYNPSPFPDWYPAPTAEAAQAIDEFRRASINRRDEMMAFQKQNSTDREAARFFKDEARDALKDYRAACLVLPYYTSDVPGDCPVVAVSKWPVELEHHIRRVFYLVALKMA